MKSFSGVALKDIQIILSINSNNIETIKNNRHGIQEIRKYRA